MGTPAFSVPFLDALIKSGRPISCVITQPDKPKGRGLKTFPPPVKELALKHSLKVLQPATIRNPSLVETIKKLDPEYIVVVAYGRIIPPEILHLPEKGCVNVHPSLLPEYRGPSPIQQAILDGRTKTGVTTMLLTEEMDAGDILLQEEVGIEKTDTAGTLSEKLIKVGTDLLIRTLKGLDKGEIKPGPQDNEKATYTHLIKKEEGLIRWDESIEKIYNKIRAFDPWPGAFTYYRGKRWIIWKIEIIEQRPVPATPGEIIEITPDGILVATGDGYVKIFELQEEGKKRMKVCTYLRGHKVETGILLRAPRD